MDPLYPSLEFQKLGRPAHVISVDQVSPFFFFFHCGLSCERSCNRFTVLFPTHHKSCDDPDAPSMRLLPIFSINKRFVGSHRIRIPRCRGVHVYAFHALRSVFADILQLLWVELFFSLLQAANQGYFWYAASLNLRDLPRHSNGLVNHESQAPAARDSVHLKYLDYATSTSVASQGNRLPTEKTKQRKR